MGVADEAPCGAKTLEGGHCGLRSPDVLPERVPRAPVHDGEAVQLDRQGQAAQVCGLLIGEFGRRPAYRRQRVRVETARVQLVDGSQIVVAGYALRFVIEQDVDASPGVRSVADNVSYRPDLIESASLRRVVQDAPEGLLVAMNVGDGPASLA